MLHNVTIKFLVPVYIFEIKLFSITMHKISDHLTGNIAKLEKVF